MSLNDLKPNPGSRRSATRVGRGIGSGSGKTAGRGHKGQKARSGGFHKVGFEGGQMPIQRRLPKFGFTSRMGRHYAEVRLHELGGVPEGEITPATLIEAGVVPLQTKTVKIILSGELGKAVKVSGCRVTKGARAAIESAGGSVDDTPPKGPAPLTRGSAAKGGNAGRSGDTAPATATAASAEAASAGDDAPAAAADAAGGDASVEARTAAVDDGAASETASGTASGEEAGGTDDAGEIPADDTRD